MFILHYVRGVKLLPSFARHGYTQKGLENCKLWGVWWLFFELIFVSPKLGAYFLGLIEGSLMHHKFVETCISSKDMKCYTSAERNGQKLYFCIEPVEGTLPILEEIKRTQQVEKSKGAGI